MSFCAGSSTGLASKWSFRLLIKLHDLENEAREKKQCNQFALKGTRTQKKETKNLIMYKITLFSNSIHPFFYSQKRKNAEKVCMCILVRFIPTP